MIQWSMKSDIARTHSRSHRHTEGLNRTIKILVIERILIMPNSGRGIRYLVGNDRTAIMSRVRLDRIDRRSRPSCDGSSRSHRGPNRRKVETGRTADTELAVGRIVVHIALPRVSLAPGVLMRGDVLRLGEIGRARIQRRIQVVHFDQKPVRCAGMRVA